MTQNAAEPVLSGAESSHSDAKVDLVWWATWMGLLAAGVALVSGVVMALEKKVITCPDGTYFPEGASDFDCYVHPDATIGIAIAALSVGVAVLVMLGNVIARASLGERPASD